MGDLTVIRSTITMFDATDVSQIPPDAEAVAGYTSGEWPTFHQLAAMFPHARRLSIAISPDEDADVLDIETGDATPESAAGWYARQRARGVARPVLYASASVMEASIVPVIRAVTIARPQVRLWSAHYGDGEHICGPSSCGLMSVQADGTQWTNTAYQRDLDQSLLLPGFFGGSPSPDWMEAMMRDLPVLREGSAGADVRTVQGLLAARGRTVAVDGVFGPTTASAVRSLQSARGLAVDAVVGPQTWVALVSAGT